MQKIALKLYGLYAKMIKMPRETAFVSSRFARELDVIRTLYRTKGCTRSDLAQEMGLHLASTGRLVSNLLERKVVRAMERPTGGAKGGRPSEYLELNSGFGIGVGIEFGRSTLTAVVTDALGKVIYQDTASELPPYSPDKATARGLVSYAKQIVATSGRSWNDVMALGVAVHDVISARGEWMTWDKPHHPPFNLMYALQQEVHCAVVVEDISRAFAEAEHKFGAARGHSDAIYLFLGSRNVGSGIFVNNTLLKSSSGLCGEIGHLIVEDDGSICQCGARGCLETVVSHDAVMSDVRSLLEQGVASSLSASDGLTFSEIYAAASKGDRAASLAIKKLTQYLAKALASTINICGATRIVIGGQLYLIGPTFLNDLTSELRARVVPTPSLVRNISVQYAELPHFAGAWGTAQQALDCSWLSGAVLSPLEVAMT